MSMIETPFEIGDKVHINGDTNGVVAMVVRFQVSSGGIVVNVEWFDTSGCLREHWFYHWQLKRIET